jgi:hypothetical protein
MTTRNTFAAVAFGAATLFLANGCGSGRGIFGEIHTMSVEVTGTGAQASELTYHLLSNDGTERAVALPWKQSAEGEFVPVSVTASAPAGTTVTCRIVVDGKAVATAASTPGMPAECRRDKVDS